MGRPKNVPPKTTKITGGYIIPPSNPPKRGRPARAATVAGTSTQAATTPPLSEHSRCGAKGDACDTRNIDDDVTCGVCLKTFSSLSNRNAHGRKFHPGEPFDAPPIRPEEQATVRSPGPKAATTMAEQRKKRGRPPGAAHKDRPPGTAHEDRPPGTAHEDRGSRRQARPKLSSTGPASSTPAPASGKAHSKLSANALPVLTDRSPKAQSTRAESPNAHPATPPTPPPHVLFVTALCDTGRLDYYSRALSNVVQTFSQDPHWACAEFLVLVAARGKAEKLAEASLGPRCHVVSVATPHISVADLHHILPALRASALFSSEGTGATQYILLSSVLLAHSSLQQASQLASHFPLPTGHRRSVVCSIDCHDSPHLISLHAQALLRQMDLAPPTKGEFGLSAWVAVGHECALLHLGKTAVRGGGRGREGHWHSDGGLCASTPGGRARLSSRLGSGAYEIFVEDTLRCAPAEDPLPAGFDEMSRDTFLVGAGLRGHAVLVPHFNIGGCRTQTDPPKVHLGPCGSSATWHLRWRLGTHSTGRYKGWGVTSAGEVCNRREGAAMAGRGVQILPLAVISGHATYSVCLEMAVDARGGGKGQVWLRPVECCPLSEIQGGEDGDLTDSDDDDGVGVDEDHFCQACGRTDRAETMLLCGSDTVGARPGCGKGYHISCLRPALTAVPKEDWYCAECEVLPQRAGQASEHGPPPRASNGWNLFQQRHRSQHGATALPELLRKWRALKPRERQRWACAALTKAATPPFSGPGRLQDSRCGAKGDACDTRNIDDDVTCGVCLKTFSSLSNRNAHGRKFHPGEPFDAPPIRPEEQATVRSPGPKAATTMAEQRRKRGRPPGAAHEERAHKIPKHGCKLPPAPAPRAGGREGRQQPAAVGRLAASGARAAEDELKRGKANRHKNDSSMTASAAGDEDSWQRLAREAAAVLDHHNARSDLACRVCRRTFSTQQRRNRHVGSCHSREVATKPTAAGRTHAPGRKAQPREAWGEKLRPVGCEEVERKAAKGGIVQGQVGRGQGMHQDTVPELRGQSVLRNGESRGEGTRRALNRVSHKPIREGFVDISHKGISLATPKGGMKFTL
eukprot:gene14342-16959_t